MASAGATVLRSPFAPLSISETLWSTAEGRLVAVVEQLLAWHDRARQRRALLRLSDDMLSDIGISRAEALKEAGKPSGATDRADGGMPRAVMADGPQLERC